jgi:signal transduction histidine kinase
MFRSFRFRLVALSMLVSAAALLAFAGLAWTLIKHNQSERFDSELEKLASRYGTRLLVSVLRSPDFATDQTLLDLKDLATERSLVYTVVNVDGTAAFQSQDWPPSVGLAAFAQASLPIPQPPADGFGFGPGNNGGRGGFGNRGFRGGPGGPGDRGGRGGGGGPDGGGGPGGGRQGGPNFGLQLDQTQLKTAPDTQPQWRFAVLPAQGHAVVFGLPLALLSAEHNKTRDTFLVALPAALALVGLGAALVASRAVKPLRKLTAAAERITAEGLNEQIPRSGEDTEFARLIDVFNAMLDRLASSFDQARRFSHDAAHELNTPLTILTGQIEQALQAAPPGSSEQQRWALLAEEVQRLRDIIRKLLLLARADRGGLHPDWQPIDLARLARDCADDAAASTELPLDVSLTGETTLPLQGDPSLLRQLLFNLLLNAVKYNRADGFVRVHLERLTRDGRDWAAVSVTNSGAPIPTEHVPHIFERFYRADPARHRGVEGLGLGLSLAREFARAHGGDLLLAKNAPDAVTFRMELPIRTEEK